MPILCINAISAVVVARLHAYFVFELHDSVPLVFCHRTGRRHSVIFKGHCWFFSCISVIFTAVQQWYTWRPGDAASHGRPQQDLFAISTDRCLWLSRRLKRISGPCDELKMNRHGVADVVSPWSVVPAPSPIQMPRVTATACLAAGYLAALPSVDVRQARHCKASLEIKTKWRWIDK